MHCSSYSKLDYWFLESRNDALQYPAIYSVASSLVQSTRPTCGEVNEDGLGTVCAL